MYRLTVVFIILILVASALCADLQTAERIANSHILMSGRGDDFVIKDHEIINRNNANILYIFDLEPAGFIAISGAKVIRPVLGYSYENSLDKTLDSPGYDFLIHSAKLRYEKLVSENRELETLRIRNRALWQDYLEMEQSLHRELLDGVW